MKNWSIFLLFLINVKLIIGQKSVDIIRTRSRSGVDNIDDDILNVLNQNDNKSTTTSATTKNFTFIDIISNVINYNDTLITTNEYNNFLIFQKQSSNPVYELFSEEIDYEAKKLFDIVPSYNPGNGPVSKECKKQSNIYQRELKKFTLWALKMYDATAKVPSGLLNGNVNQLGDYDECINADDNNDIKGKYCLVYLQFDIDKSRPDLKFIHRLLHSHYAFKSNLTDPGHRVPRFGTINWAVCAPSACTSNDVEKSMKYTLDKYTEGTGLKITVKVDKEMCQERMTSSYPMETIFVGSIFLGIVLISIISGLCDYNDIPLPKLILAFSLNKNIKKLISLERNSGDIETLHGIRALNALMLLLSHKSLAIFFNPIANRTYIAEFIGKPWSVIGRAASLYTDPFLMLSGLLATYSSIGKLNKNGKLDVKSEYINRFFRIVPPLAALILFCTYVMPFIGSGPQWNLVVTHHANICKKTWWRNFLFIHNYFGFENMCLTHTHHTGIDTQLFVISPIMILLMYKKPKIGAILLTIIALYSTALRYFVTLNRRLNNYVFFGTSIRQLFDTADYSYSLPSHRLTVYILGVFAGYLLRIWPKNHKLNETIVHIGWIVSTVMCLAAAFGPANMGNIDYIYQPIHAAAYNAFSPIGWCVIFIWITFLAHTGNGDGWLCKFFSWKGFLITTRLSYAIYLTQFPVFFFNVGQTRSAEHSGFFKSLISIKEYAWVLIASLVLTLLFELPFQNIKNIYFPSKRENARSEETSSSNTKNIKSE